MLLKNSLTTFKLSIKESNSNLGLEEEDNWCLINISIKKEKKEYTIERESLSKKEIANLIKEVDYFFEDKTVRKKRISFIKNHLVIYLEKKKNNYKLLKLKIIHEEKENDIIEFEKEEVYELISIFQNFIEKKAN